MLIATRRRALAAGLLPLAALVPRSAHAALPGLPRPERELLVSNDARLAVALREAGPGDHIVLATGATAAR